jgi:hypothetical protein
MSMDAVHNSARSFGATAAIFGLLALSVFVSPVRAAEH